MEGRIVLAKIATLFLLIAAGWASRRRGMLTGDATTVFGRFVVDLCLPALVFVQMVRTVDRETWRGDAATLAIATLVILLALGTGWVTSRVLAPPESRPTFAFLVGIPNWIYLPLPIAQALHGDAGVRAVLLGNISAQIVLWTAGVAMLRGKPLTREALRNSVANPGILAAAAGIALALLAPGLRTWTSPGPGASAGWFDHLGHTLFDSLSLLGSLTIPLSLVLIGAQLGGLALGHGQSFRSVSAVLIARLAIAPCVTLIVFAALSRFGVVIPEVPRMVAYLVAAMPVAVSCSVFAERFGGDVALSAKSVAFSTLASIATVPLFVYLVRRLAL